MHNYIEFFDNMPLWVVVTLMIIFGAIQGIGEILEIKGKIVPEFMSMRKYLARKKREKDAMRRLPDFIDKQEVTLQDVTTTLANVQGLYKDIQGHYSEDNIAKRDGWMKEVNEHIASSEQRRAEQAIVLKEQAEVMNKLSEKLDKNNADTLSLLIDNKRNFILDFSSKYSDVAKPATREQYKRFFKVYEEYENIIHETGRTNGEVDIAYRMAVESYECRMKNCGFIEDIRGYNS